MIIHRVSLVTLKFIGNLAVDTITDNWIDSSVTLFKITLRYIFLIALINTVEQTTKDIEIIVIKVTKEFRIILIILRQVI